MSSTTTSPPNRLSGVWDVDAIIISYVSLSTIDRLYSGLGNKQNGFMTLCYTLGAGRGHRPTDIKILLLLHRMVEMRLGESFPLALELVMGSKAVRPLENVRPSKVPRRYVDRRDDNVIVASASTSETDWFWLVSAPYIELLSSHVHGGVKATYVSPNAMADLVLPSRSSEECQYHEYLLDTIPQLVQITTPGTITPSTTVNKRLWTILENIAKLCSVPGLPPPVYPILTRLVAPYANGIPLRYDTETLPRTGVRLTHVARYDRQNGNLVYDGERYFCDLLIDGYLVSIGGMADGQGKGLGDPDYEGPRYGLRAWANNETMVRSIGYWIVAWFVWLYEGMRVRRPYAERATLTPEDQDAIVSGILTLVEDDGMLPWDIGDWHTGYVYDAVLAGMTKRVDGLLTILTRMRGWEENGCANQLCTLLRQDEVPERPYSPEVLTVLKRCGIVVRGDG